MQMISENTAPFAVAYLVNCYPATSHSFIRREIRALEAEGVAVTRISIRAATDLIDPQDIAEAEKTSVILQGGVIAASVKALAQILRNPLKFFVALMFTLLVGFGSKSGLLRHFGYLLEACIVARELERVGARHLHAHFATNSCDVAMYCNALTGIPYSFTLHGSNEIELQLSLRVPLKIKRSKATIAISDFARAQLMRWSNSDDWGKIFVVRCGLDEGEFEKPKPVADSRYLLSIGRLVPQKGQILLIDAARVLRDSGVDFKLSIIGDGELLEAIKTRIGYHGLEGHISLLGWQSGAEVMDQLMKCRAMVLPSLAEGLPVSIMEAFAMGRPVISTFVAGIPELVTPQCGWLVPAGNVGDLAQAMREALEAPAEKLTEMGLVGAARVWEMHDIKAAARKLIDIFSSE